MLRSSSEEWIVLLCGAFGPREPGFRFLRLGNAAPQTALAGTADELGAQGEVRDAHAHRLEDREIVSVRAPASPGDELRERQDLVPAARGVTGHELARKLLHAREIVDRDARRAREHVL